MQSIDFSSVQQNEYDWSEPIFTPSMGYVNSYSIGTKKNNKQTQIFKKYIKGVYVDFDYFLQRVQKLEKFSHANYVPVKIVAGNNVSQSDKQFYVRKIKVFSPYIKSISLKSILKKKQIIPRNNFMSMIIQVIQIMNCAQRQNIHHCRLNINSILIDQNEKNFIIKICDWGYGNQPIITQDRKIFKQEKIIDKQKIKESSMYQFLHPALIFDSKSTVYQSQYDIWSFAIVLFYLRYFQHPFNGKLDKIFDIKSLKQYYKKKSVFQNSLLDQTFISMLIKKMLSLNQLNTWKQVKQFLINEGQQIEMDFETSNEIYQKYYNIILYLISMYKHILWCVTNSPNSFFYQNKFIVKRFMIYLLKFMDILHNQKFKQRFSRKITMMNQKQKQKIYQLSILILQESNKYSQNEKKSIFMAQQMFQILQSLRKYLLTINMRMTDCQKSVQMSSLGARVKNLWKSVKLIKDFCENFNIAISNMKNRNKNIFPQLFYMIERHDNKQKPK